MPKAVAVGHSPVTLSAETGFQGLLIASEAVLDFVAGTAIVILSHSALRSTVRWKISASAGLSLSG